MLQKAIPHGNKKVFFGRITNDGYKTKKKARIAQGGGQLGELLDNFSNKKSKDKFSAYVPLGEDAAEWAPEAFLTSGEALDGSFSDEFEMFMRKQAAFYISNGWKLSGNNNENLSPGTITQNIFSRNSMLCMDNVREDDFYVKDYFDVVLGGKDEIEDLADGDVPFVSTSEFMNGVTSWKAPNFVYEPPCITVATDGSTCSSFVQEFSFYAFYKVAIIRPKPSIQVPVDALYFISYMFTREKWKYVYARKFGKKRIENTMLRLPCKDGRPDFEFMAATVQKALSYPIIEAFRSLS
jgi:hypothetical protein